MEKQFPSREEAEKEVARLNSLKEAEWFCPLIRLQCRRDCVCFYPADVRRRVANGVESFYAGGFCCNNHMFFGE